MELVRGVPLNEYCDKQKLNLEQRLDLFARICDGVQHAHQKGVIHRDLKPGNILVTDADRTEPQPKIIDFGIAKATSKSLAEKEVFTLEGQLIGTPEYMSPEQAEMTSADIDTIHDRGAAPGVVRSRPGAVLRAGSHPPPKGEPSRSARASTISCNPSC